MTAQIRIRAQRMRDALLRLEHDVDAWVATAGAGGAGPYLIPLSFLWDDGTLLVATPEASPTARNLRATGRVRIGIGPTRDLVLIDGTVRSISADVPQALGDAFAAKAGFDPRGLVDTHLYFRIEPFRIQSWREADELVGRVLMRGGRWLAD